jgi:arsenate reductase (thioredoxin)
MVPPDEIKPGNRGNRPRMGGERVARPQAAGQGAPQPAPAEGAPAVSKKTRVLFLCIGNSCRSQMAEAFARAYGSDILVAESAGLMPADIIAPMTRQVLAERNLNINDHYPKGLEIAAREPFDVVVNMSGERVNLPDTREVMWPVRDPIGLPESVYQSVVQQIEGLVMGLILDLRSGREPG